MFIFIYISFQAEKYYYCPRETKTLIEQYKNRNKSKTMQKNPKEAAKILKYDVRKKS